MRRLKKSWRELGRLPWRKPNFHLSFCIPSEAEVCIGRFAAADSSALNAPRITSIKIIKLKIIKH
jgi:hypothetical protein